MYASAGTWKPRSALSALSALAAGLAVGVGAPVPAASSAGEPPAPTAGTYWTEVDAAVAARTAGRRVEVTGQRTRSRTVFAEPDGTFTAELAAQPVRVRQGADWVPVDTTLTARPDGSVAPRATVPSLTLSGGGSDAPLVRLTGDGKSIELSWSAALPEPELTGDTATYREVFSGVDLTVRATLRGFAQSLVVRSREAARHVERIGFGLRTSGVTMRADQRHNVDAVDGTGRVVFHSPAPQLWDATRPGPDSPIGPDRGGVFDGARQAMGTVELTADRITVVPDRAFLADAATVYPVTIDPDYEFHAAETFWAKVLSGYPSQAYPLGGMDGADAKVGYCNWPGCNGVGVGRSYFQYDTRWLAGRRILSAEFNAHAFHAASCALKPIQLWRTHWPVDRFTAWDRQPPSDFVLSRDVGCPGFVGYHDVGWAVRPGGETTFMLKAANEGDRDAWRKFDWNPRLIVHYNSYPGVPTSLSADNKGCRQVPNQTYSLDGRPWLRANVADPDGGNMYAHFEWWERNPTTGARTLRGGSQVGHQGSGTQFQVQLPRGVFDSPTTVKTMSWRVRGFDGTDYSAFTGFCDVTVDMVKPDRLPVVESATYPPCSEDPNDPGGCPQTGEPGMGGVFTFRPNGLPDIGGYKYGPLSATRFVPAGPDGSATIFHSPPKTGTQDLHVMLVDKAGNEAPDNHIAKYHFNVGLPGPPRGHWRLDGIRADNTAPDATGNGRTGTPGPAGGYAWTPGRVDDGIRFNGSTGHVSTATSPIRTDWSFTVAAWVRLDSGVNGYYTAVSQDGVQAAGFYLQHAADLRRWAFVLPWSDSTSSPAYTRAVAATPPEVGVWTHLAGTYDMGTGEATLYVNGAVAGQAVHPTRWNAGGGMQIGRARGGTGFHNPWPGAVDDVKLYQRELLADEIILLANRPTVDQGRWMFDESSGTTAADVSGHFRTGSLVNGATFVTPGRVGPAAVRLRGTAHVSTADPAVRTDGSFTVSAWVNPDLDGLGTAMRTAVSQDGNRVSRFTLGYRGDTGKWAFALRSSDADGATEVKAEATTSPAAATWTHLTGVYDAAAGQVRLYVNGDFKGVHDVPASWPSWQPTGAVQIGRGKRSGAVGDYFQGAIDDVRIFAGVRSDGLRPPTLANPLDNEIKAEFRSPPGPPVTPYTGQFGRFVNHAGDHFTATGPVPGDYHFEATLGLPAPETAPNTRLLYACRAGTDEFTTPDPNCEGYTRLGQLGSVYTTPPAGVPTRGLYRCQITASGEHFDSLSADCEGQRVEWLLGYVRPYAHLVRHVNADPPWDHWTSTSGISGRVPVSYQPEGAVGIVPLSAEPGTVPLTACLDGTDAFSSTDPACEGKQVVGPVGGLYVNPPAGVTASRLLYRCRTAEDGELFDSLLPDCEGRIVDRPLGYLIYRW